MTLKKYITESERAVAFPVTGDVLEVVVREDFDDEIAIDFPVVEHKDRTRAEKMDEAPYQTQTHPTCLLYTSPSPRDRQKSRMPSSA